MKSIQFNQLSLASIAGLTIVSSLLAVGCSNNSATGNTPDAGNSLNTASTGAKSGTKIAFLVKQPEEPWFQLEWKFAEEAAAKDGFELIKLGVTDSDQVLSKIENVAAQGAQGIVICSPDVKLGTAIEKKCKDRNLKLMSVDDQLLGSDGKPLDIPHLGISAKKIGTSVGTALMEEMAVRKWDAKETGLLVITRDELDTAKERTDGAIEGTKGFSADHIFKAPQKTTDVPGGRDAASVVLTQHPEIKHWLIAGMNDTAVMGAVRATESRNILAADVVGIGINGSEAVEDLKKDKPNGVFGSILLQAKRHGYETSDAMFKWITTNTAPPKITYTDGILLTRKNYVQVLKEQGLSK